MRAMTTGYAAFDKASGRGLAITFGFTNKLSLTEDPAKVHIADDLSKAECYTVWYNKSHKKPKEFEIKKVTIVTELVIH